MNPSFTLISIPKQERTLQEMSRIISSLD